MKKLLIILLVLFSITSLYAEDPLYGPLYFYQIFSSAMSFDLSVTNRGPHNKDWAQGSREGKPSGGNYYDDDMVGVIGVTNKFLDHTQVDGVLVHMQILNNSQFRTNVDYSAYRNFGIELIPKIGRDTYGTPITLTMYKDRAMTTEIEKTTHFHVCDNNNPEVWFVMEMDSELYPNPNVLWCDLIMVIDSSYEDDSLVVDDGYYANVIMELYPWNVDEKTVDSSVAPFSLNFDCSGHYGTSAPDNFQLYNCFIKEESIANYFDLKADSAWNDYTKVATLMFSSSTYRVDNRNEAGRDYRIIISPTSDYNSEAFEFQFNRDGGKLGDIKNTCFYKVALVPEPISWASEYPLNTIVDTNYLQIADSTSQTAYKDFYGTRTTPAISGNEEVIKRQVQVPYYEVGYVPANSKSSYVFNYEAGLYIKLTGFEGEINRDNLSSGLYSSVLYVTVISE